ncbi:ABC transporter permease [Inhella sp.]|uniref:ABC transporter permease n=1 Tax=Inhella sp. TaxID=1921806 RepID=UPI0035B26687
MNHLLPILSTLRRHRIAAGLIVLEVALSFAIVSNAVHVIGQRLGQLNADSGLPEAELLNLEVRNTRRLDNPDALSDEDLRRLRALPGVKSASIPNQVIYGDNVNVTGVSTEPDNRGQRVQAFSYSGDEQLLPTMGLRLIGGRAFNKEEVQLDTKVSAEAEPKLPVVIVNQALAEALAPGQSPLTVLGRSVYVFGNQPSQIIGIVENLGPPNPRHTKDRAAVMLPITENFRGGTYLVRVQPGQAEAVIKAARQIFKEVEPSRLLTNARLLTEMRERHYAQDRSMVGLLVGVCVALLLITALGIVGLASFWVEQRGRMIGIRRALGATRADIRRYFQQENLLLCGVGVVLGSAAALGINQWLVRTQDLPVLPLWMLLPAAAALLGLGQLAVLAPAQRASGVAPALAMRAG